MNPEYHSQDDRLTGSSSSSTTADQNDRTTHFTLASPKICLLHLLALTSVAIGRKAEPQALSKATEEFYSVQWQISDASKRTSLPTTISCPSTISKKSAAGSEHIRCRSRGQLTSAQSGLRAVQWTALALEGLQKKERTSFHAREGSHPVNIIGVPSHRGLALEAVRALLRTACLEDSHLQSKVCIKDSDDRPGRHASAELQPGRSAVSLTPM